MQEVTGDLWHYRRIADAICITTNGTVKDNGCAVMGRGVALQAKEMYRGVDRRLGARIRRWGNVTQPIMVRRRRIASHGARKPTYVLVSLPVKHAWWEEADIHLIESSCRQLVELANRQDWKMVALPRPGCGNGKLHWSAVRVWVEPILDDRFVIVNNEGEGDRAPKSGIRH